MVGGRGGRGVKVSKRDMWQTLAAQGRDPAVMFDALGLKTPGPKRAQAAPERDVLNAVLAMLRTHPAVAWAARVNSGAYKTPDGRFIRFGFAGCPDILGQMKCGQFLAIECKSDIGRATEDQAAFIDKVLKFGGKAGIARCVEDALAIVDAPGVVTVWQQP